MAAFCNATVELSASTDQVLPKPGKRKKLVDARAACVVIVIVYANIVKREITNKAIVVVYLKLCTVSHRIVRIIKNF